MKEEDIYRMIAGPEEGKPADEEIEVFPVSPEVTRRALDPPLLGDLPFPDGYAHLTGECGDTMEVFLTLRGSRIREARFDTLGCGFTLACGSVAMEMAQGHTLAEAMRVDAKKIADALGGLPPTHEHCAGLAAETLKKAIRDALTRGNEPWKKLYRNR